MDSLKECYIEFIHNKASNDLNKTDKQIKELSSEENLFHDRNSSENFFGAFFEEEIENENFDDENNLFILKKN